MALGSDYGFYGGGGLSDLLWGGTSSFSSPYSYSGYSAYTPSFGSGMPSTIGGFLQSGYIPELAGNRNAAFQLGGDLQSLYSQFLSEGAADPSGFAQGLTQREDVQALLRQQEFKGAEAFIDSDQGRGLSEIVAELMGDEGSLLSNLYGTAGVGADVASSDIQRLLTGGDSAIGDLAGYEFFGNAGQLTTAGREAVAAQLLGGGGGLVSLGGGQAFNPFSGDLLTDEYDFRSGVAGDISGTELLRLSGGLLSKHNLDVTKDIAGAFQTATETGADMGFGGPQGYRLTQNLANYARTGAFDPTQGEAYISGQGGFGSLIDQWYGGQTNADWGRGLGWSLGGMIQTR